MLEPLQSFRRDDALDLWTGDGIGNDRTMLEEPGQSPYREPSKVRGCSISSTALRRSPPRYRLLEEDNSLRDESSNYRNLSVSGNV